MTRLAVAVVVLMNVGVSLLLAADPHWSFRRVVRPALPQVQQVDWVRNGIDAFVLARLEKEGFAPSPEADRATLIRRVTLDLIGLPPTPNEVAEFLADERPDAYERLVNRLLASPHYGERWARQWLDLCHYGDSDGHLTDQLRPVAWRYRDWVVRMLNDNLPFDEFTTRQLAGDLLTAHVPASHSFDRILGTGFLRQTLSNREGGADLEEFRVAQVVDRTSMVGTIWLGLTVGCARCHDHKYDPLSQHEFYRLYAFFDDVDEVNIDAPLKPEAAEYQTARMEYERRRREIVEPYRAGLSELQKQWEAKCLHAAAHPGEDHVWDRQWEVLGLIWGGNLGEGQLEGCEIVRRPWDQRTTRQQDDLLDYFLARGSVVDEKKFAELKLHDLQKQLVAMKKEFPAAFPTRAPVMRAAFAPRQTYLHERGDFRSRGADVSAGMPEWLDVVGTAAASFRETKAERAVSVDQQRKADRDDEADSGSTLLSRNDRATNAGRAALSRLDLARWLMSRDNPLTARVTVNRMWQEFFGRGIVATSDDFGTRGDLPSHPELLDWLAAEFTRSNWNIKNAHRLIVTSATYRQSSQPREELATADPHNVLLARQNSLRVSAESVRDAALAASGLLSRKLGGPSVFPPQDARVTMEAFGSNEWKVSDGTDRYRRGLYTFIQRTSPFAQAITFDAPPPVDVCTRRDRSNTPLQALTLLNDPVFGEMAAALGSRLQNEGGPTDQSRIEFAWTLCLGRQATADEQSRAEKYLDELRREKRNDSAAWTSLASVLLNLHEFITRD